MDDVATEAGVGKGTIYRYFEDKDELYLALLDRAGRQLDARIRERVDAAGTPQRNWRRWPAKSSTFSRSSRTFSI